MYNIILNLLSITLLNCKTYVSLEQIITVFLATYDSSNCKMIIIKFSF